MRRSPTTSSAPSPNPCWAARSTCSCSLPLWPRAPPALSPHSCRPRGPCWRWAPTRPSRNASPRSTPGLTAFACIWYFRHELFADVQSFVFKLLFPSLGGLGLLGVFMVTLRDSASPDYGSGASIFGVGLVLILGLGMI